MEKISKKEPPKGLFLNAIYFYNLHYEKIGNETTCIEDIIPFEIPDSWSWVRLGLLFSHNTGKALNAKNTAGNLLTYITTSNLYWNRFELGELKSMPFTDEEVEKCTVKKGDLLVCEGGDIGRAAIWNYDFPIRIQNHIHRLRAYSNIEILFYYYVLFFYKFTGRIGGKGIGIQGLSSNALHSIIVPLPPQKEQSIIVNKLFAISAIIDSAEQEQNNLQTIVAQAKSKILDLAIRGKLVPQDPNDEPASVLLERIRAEKKAKLGKKYVDNYIFQGDDKSYYELPNGWEMSDVDNYVAKVTDFVASGSFASLRENVQYYKRDNYALLVKTKDFANNFSNDLTYTDKKGYQFLSNSNLFGGELILCNVGSIGKVFRVPYLNRPMTLAPNSIMIRCMDDMHYDWLQYLFLSKFGYDSLKSITSATANSKFNKTDFKKLSIPIPPLAEQQRIVAAIETTFKQLDEIAKALLYHYKPFKTFCQ